MQRPSFQFYPADWLGNSNLRRCSHAEKGAWIDVVCLFHDAPEYGVIRWPLKDIAQAIGCDVALLHALILKGVMKGTDAGDCDAFVFIPRHGRKDGDPVILVTAQAGPIWYSSRMVRDEYVRRHRGEGSRFGADDGGQSDSPKQAPNATPKAAPKPPIGDGSSSSSSSSSKPSCAIASHGDVGKDDPEGFSECWEAYPKRSGGNSRKEAEKAYRARLKTGVDPADMLAGVQRYATYIRGTEREGTAYVKQAATFFGTGEHWKEAYDLPGGFPGSDDWRNSPAFRGCA